MYVYNSVPFVYFRDHFYQFGELRSVTMVSRQQCAFVQFTTRAAGEAAAEKSFNKLILGGRRLNIKWGRAQAQQAAIKKEGEEDESMLEPVPGLPGGESTNPPFLRHVITRSFTVQTTVHICHEILFDKFVHLVYSSHKYESM